MFIRAPEAHSRSFVKAVSWRIVGSIDTFFVSFLVTGHIGKAASIASVESVTKIILYYVHERAWTKVRWGGAPAETAETKAEPVVAASTPEQQPAAA